MRVYIDDLEPLDLTDEQFRALDIALDIVHGLDGEPRLAQPLAALVFEARCLRSEDSENPEYDRALVELVLRFAGYSDDDRALFEALVLG